VVISLGVGGNAGYNAFIVTYLGNAGFIDGIESNGVYSYIINETYMDRAGNREIKEYLFNLFYVIYHDEALPYTVYFSESYIFLISKEESFDKSCIDIFNQTEGLYLFKE
jgi:hypothetical protein